MLSRRPGQSSPGLPPLPSALTDSGEPKKEKGTTEDGMVGWHHRLNGHRFSRKEYWSGLPCPPQGILSIQGTNPYLLCLLLRQAGSLPLSHLGSPI